MKAIVNRLRRLERAAAPAARELADAEMILENMRGRLGSDYEPTEYPPAGFAGYRSTADRSLRAGKFCREREGARDQSRGTAAIASIAINLLASVRRNRVLAVPERCKGERVHGVTE
jgi:hypothetical protein